MFALVAKIVGLCIERAVIDEAEDARVREMINADPVRWIMSSIPIFYLLRQGKADNLQQVIKLTLNLVASRAPENTVSEIQEKLIELEWIEITSSPPRITCPEPGFELDKLMCSVLKPKGSRSEPYDQGEEVVQPENAAATAPSAPIVPSVALVPAPKKIPERDRLRIFAITKCSRKSIKDRTKLYILKLILLLTSHEAKTYFCS